MEQEKQKYFKKLDRSPMQVGFWLKRINEKTNKLYTEEEAKYKISTFRKTNINYWLNKGYSEEEAKINLEKYQKYSANIYYKYKQKNPEKYKATNTTQLDYWLKRGYSQEEAKIKLKERQTTFSLEKCIEKYGEIEGKKKWEERQQKWQNTLNNKSKEELYKINKSKNIFSKLYNQPLTEELLNQYLEICKIRNIICFKTKEESINYIQNLALLNHISHNNENIKYFIDNICPKHLYKIFNISYDELFSLIKETVKDINNDIYFINGNKVSAYHQRVNDVILLSSNEIYFYNLCKKMNISIDEINKKYDNSNLRYDFKINNNFIELAGLLENSDYYSKILYKRETFKSFILTNKKEYEDFLTRVIINKNEEAINYYLTRSI